MNDKIKVEGCVMRKRSQKTEIETTPPENQ